MKNKIIGQRNQGAVQYGEFEGTQWTTAKDVTVFGAIPLGIVDAKGVSSCVQIVDSERPVPRPPFHLTSYSSDIP